MRVRTINQIAEEVDTERRTSDRLVKVCGGARLIVSKPKRQYAKSPAVWRRFVERDHFSCGESSKIDATLSICERQRQPEHCPLSQAEYDALPTMPLCKAYARMFGEGDGK